MRPAGAPAVIRTADSEKLRRLLAGALKRARRSGRPTLACHAVDIDAAADPAAWVAAARRPGEDLFLFEQPERDGAALAALGGACRIEERGPERFARVAARWRELAAEAESGDGPGPIVVGGFAFADDGGSAEHWQRYAPASLAVPELALVRRGGAVQLLLSALVGPDDMLDELAARLEGRAGELHAASLPLLDPAPAGRYRVLSTMPPEHHEQAVQRATELIAAGRFQKIVLAREVQIHGPVPFDPLAVFGVLREQFPSCFDFCVQRGASSFIAASPELLVRREGQRVSTVALAASTRRSADPAVDDHLGEQMLRDQTLREEHEIVARRIERTLEPFAVWVAKAPEPEIVRIANIQHLATPIRAQLARPMDALELAGAMHPTPAVGGEPLAAAAPMIPALEGLDRGWYLGPVGWTDAVGDGEFCVALRCALLEGSVARCYAGGGIVRDSDPALELAETEIKLQALLPLLAG
jgi:salicylate biosynthesis isochorismate synthase/menaquinone-specific isochorismate synthase